MIEYCRPCGHCDYVHVFVSLDDDEDACPRCGGGLSPIATIVTEVAAAADRIERALVEGEEAIACRSRIDDAAALGDRPVVRDIAVRLAEAALTGPIVGVIDCARAFARAALKPATSANADSVVEAAQALRDAALALETQCAACGTRGPVAGDTPRCASCALSARCQEALSTFDNRDARSFVEKTREILAERPSMTVVEFFERALGEWDPQRSSS